MVHMQCNLLEVFLFEISDGFVNLKVMCEFHVIGGFHLFYAPAKTKLK